MAEGSAAAVVILQEMQAKGEALSAPFVRIPISICGDSPILLYNHRGLRMILGARRSG